MKTKLKLFFKNVEFRFRALLSKSEDLEHVQFLSVFAILAVVSVVMSIMNFITHWEMLMWSTIAFAIASLMNVLLTIRKGICEIIARWAFAFEIIILFTFFLVMGEPQGFSANWIALLPSAGLLLYRAKKGTILALVQFLILAFLLWTPIGRGLLRFEYTEAFMMRFPVLYLSFLAVGLFFEIVRNTTQQELVKAKDKYASLYSDEKINAELEKEKNFEIIKVLASEYSSVYYVNLQNDTFEPYTLNDTVSKEFEDIFKTDIPYSKAYKMYVEKAVYKEDQKEMLNAGALSVVRDHLLSSHTYITTFRSNNPDEPHYCVMKFVRMVNETGEPEYAALGFEDNHEKIKKEQEYQQTLKDARDKAEIASAAKTDFLFNMSHDIRTPMNAIMGFTDMAKKYLSDPDKAEDYIDKVKVSSKHLLDLINNVLDMSRIESGKVEIEPSVNNVDDYIAAIDAIASDSAKAKDISFTIVKENIIHENLYIDTLHVNQVLLNLVGNAVKYTKPNGAITVTVRENDIGEKQGFTGVDFIVADTGIGMSENYLTHIFEAFSREKNTTASGIQGTGLGMAITKKLVDLMNGTIDVESKLGVGSTFTVHFDFQIYDTVISRTNKEEEEEEADNVSVSGTKLLLVDDNDLNREIAKDLLEEFGIIIEEANDGSVAVEMIKKNSPTYYNYVLMDIQMPYMDGYKATRAIRTLTNDDYSKLPIIAMTANAFEEDRKNAFDAGMDEHLAKPIDIAKTLATLKKFLKK